MNVNVESNLAVQDVFQSVHGKIYIFGTSRALAIVCEVVTPFNNNLRLFQARTSFKLIVVMLFISFYSY